MRSTLFSAACCTLALMAPGLVHAQGAGNYPLRPITLVVGTGAGNVTDTESRLWARKLADGLGQPIVVDNKGGAGATIGARQVATAKPDGYTLGTVLVNNTLMGLRYQDLGFDLIKSFENISLLNNRSGLMAVHPSLPINNVKEFVAYAKSHPGELNWAASGEGSNDHIAGAWMMQATGTKVNFIHYKSSSVGYADFQAGRVHIMTFPYDAGGAYSSMVKTGKARNIGTTTLQRSRMAPDVPTLNEQGITGYDVSNFLGINTTGKTPVAVVNRLHAEIVKVAKDPDMQKQLGDGSYVVANTPQEFTRWLVAKIDHLRKLGQELNITYSPE